MKRSMKLWTLVLPLAASFAPLDPAAGQEPHFTFTVPVEAVNMTPEVSAVRVQCRVHTTAIAPSFASPEGSSRIGENTVDVPVSAGQDVVSDVTVTVNVLPDRNPGEAKSYNCMLFLLNGTTQALAGLTSTPARPWSERKPGSEYAYQARGTIP